MMDLSQQWRLLTGIATLLGLSQSVGAQARPDQQRLRLEQAVARALASHPSIRSAQAGTQAADAAAGEARSRMWPDLTIRASVTQFQKPMIVAPLHRFDISQVPEFDRTLIGGNVSLIYTLFDGGSRSAQVDRSEAGAAAASFEHETAAQHLISEVTEAYLAVLTADGIKQAQDRRIQALESERARVTRLLEAGNAARVELLRVDAALASAEAERVTIATTLDQSEHDLARLVGSGVTETRAGRLEPVRLRAALSLDDRGTLSERAAADNATVAQARERVRAARATERAARAAWLPQLDVAAGYLGYAAPDADASAEWQAGFRLSYPVFTGGRRLSAVRRARADALLATERLRLAELVVERQVDRAVNAVRAWRARANASASAVDHLTEVARIERLALAEGVGTQTEYVRSEADLVRARAQLVEARHAEIAAWVALARSLGELSTEWLGHTLESTP